MEPKVDKRRVQSIQHRCRWVGALLVLVITSASCTALGPNVLNSSISDGKLETRSATEVDEIDVYWLDAESEVPQGVIFRSPSERSFDDRLQLEPGYPNSQEAHVWTGSYLVRFADSFDRKTLEDAFKEEAAKSGANALFLETEQNTTRAKAAYLSDESPQVERRPADDALSRLRAMEGYSVADTAEVSLADAARLTIDGQQGSCYFLVFALKEDATLTSNARQSFRFQYHSDDKTIESRPPRPQFEHAAADNRLTPRSRSGHLRVGCPETSAPIEIEMFTGSDRHRSYRLGSGIMAVEVLVADASEE